jgi:hypothetical protein
VPELRRSLPAETTSAVGLVVAGLVTTAVWWSHLPSLLLDPQFYADDGGWYQAAYMHGPVLSLPHTGGGYLVLLQRLGASMSLAVPTLGAPLFFNLVALAVEITGVCYLLSSRMASAIPRLWIRIALALLVLVLPNAYDTSGNLTNAQWHLGLIAFLVFFARPPRHLAGWMLDVGIVILAGLTGPYCILLEPIVLWLWLRDRRSRRLGVLAALNTLCAGAQVLVIAAHLGGRSTGQLAPGALPLVTMIARQVTLGLVAGAHGLTRLIASPLAADAALLTLLALLPVLVCGWAVLRGPLVLRCFCVFAAAELVLALTAPSIPSPQWPALGQPASVSDFHPGGIRYFLYPLLAFAASLGWIAVRGARSGELSLRLAGACAALVLAVSAAVGVPADWSYPHYRDEHWPQSVQRLQHAPAGTVVTVPINPKGWTMTLVAR